jgi:hypothetical protein
MKGTDSSLTAAPTSATTRVTDGSVLTLISLVDAVVEPNGHDTAAGRGLASE